MKWLSQKFEEMIESFLKKNIERHTRILSWAVLPLILIFMWAGYLFLDYRVEIKNPETGQTTSSTIGRLIFSNKK